MISIEAYRTSIGNFNYTSQYNLKTIYRNIIIGSHMTSSGLACLLKLASFCSLLLHLVIVLLLSGDVELNPGPCTPTKSIKGSFHQGNPRFGNTAGSQCMCNAFWAICYSKIKCVCYWAQWDLDIILQHGNDLYKELGYLHEHLSFIELPNQINVNKNIIDVLKSDTITAELSSNTASFLRLPQEFNCGMLLTCGYSTAFIYKGGSVYIFDSHSRDANGLSNPNGTSVLLKFDSYYDAESYIKRLYLIQFENASIFCQIQYMNVSVSEINLTELKMNFQNLKKRDRLDESERNTINKAKRTDYIKKRASLAESEKEAINSERRTKRALLAESKKEAINSERRKKRALLAESKKEAINSERRKKRAFLAKSEKEAINSERRKKRASLAESEKETINSERREKRASLAESEKEAINSERRKKRASLAESEKETINSERRKKRASLAESEKEAINSERRKKQAFLAESEKEAINSKRRKKRQLVRKALFHSDSTRRIETFKTEVSNGPYYFCVICNRSLYHCSVLLFNDSKYNETSESVYDKSRIPSYDGREYICKTCHSKISKNKVPCQAVCNDLQIYKLPDRFSDIRRLERIIISKRLLFKKVTIMSKGQAPKMKGAICNVPINVEDICNVLPRGMDNNGIVRVSLKKKMSFKSNVFFEPIRPNFVRNVLLYLKTNNPLYTDIVIDLDAIPQYWVNMINNDDELGNDGKKDEIVITDGNEIHFVNEQSIPTIQDGLLKEEDINPLDNFRLSASETAYVPDLAFDIVDSSNVIIAPGENKKPVSIICDKNCEMLAHPHLFPNGKFGYTHTRDIKLSPCKYFNQRLLNCTQKFASDPDYIFYAQSVTQHINLNSCINIAMKKIRTEHLTAGQLSQNFKETVNSLIANDNAFNFMNNLKGTPAYWKRFLLEVLAMVKQLGLPTYFMTLSCADLRWNELVDIIKKLKGQKCSEEEIKNMNYMERTTVLQSNPVLLARHFQYRVENFFKYIVSDGTLGKVIHYAIRVEFQVRGSPHIHSLLWIENAPKLDEKTKDEYIKFVDNAVKCEFPDNDGSDLFQLVKTYQTHHHSKSCRKYKNIECRYSFGKFFCDRTIVASPLPDVLTPDERNDILHKKKEILSKVKQYINKRLDPKYNNIHESTKEDYREPESMNDILTELGITKETYYECLSISPDNSYQIHFKRSTKSCFTNNYFEEGILAWEANIDIQPVLDYYKAVAYMCAYLSKSEDESTEAMKQAAKEASEAGKTLQERMKSISKAYRTHREMSIQEAVSIVLPEIWLRKTSPTVTFANSNLPENRYRVCKTEEEISNMDADETNIFKKNMLDRYIDRPDREFKNGKYAGMDSLCYAIFLSNYSLDSKKRDDERNDCQPEVLEEIISMDNDLHLPRSIPLMSSKEYLKLRGKKCVLRYHVPNRLKKPEAYAHHLLFMFYPFRNERDLNATLSKTFAEKLLERGVMETINRNKKVCEPYGEVVDEAFICFNENARNLDPFGEQENDEVRERAANRVETDEEELEDSDRQEHSGGAPSYTITPIISDDDLNKQIRSLNMKQRNIFNYVLGWTRRTIQSFKSNHVSKPEPFHIFLTGSAGCGKSHLLTTIKFYLQKSLTYGSTDANKERIVVLAPTGVAAVNVDGSTIHSTLGIIPDRSSGKCVCKLSDKKRSSLRQRFSELMVIIIDEISMVSNKLLLYIHQRLCDIFGDTDDNPFAGISIIACGDFYQLPPIQQRPVFAEYSDQMLNIAHCWRYFKIAELTEVMRQKGDQTFIDVLNNIRQGKITDKDIKLLESRFISENNPDFPFDTIHIWAENAFVNEHNRKMLEQLPGEQKEILALDKIPENIPESVLNKIYERNQMETGGLAYKLIIKLNAQVMLTTNIDVEDKLCNGQIGKIRHLAYDSRGDIKKIYLEMEGDDVGLKAMNSDKYNRAHKLVPIERVEKEIKIKKNRSSSPSIKRLQFPLVLSWACTVHKVQGKTFSKIVFSFNLLKQKRFNSGQVYVGLSRVTSLQGLFLTGKFNKKSITLDQRATDEYNYMRINAPLQPVEIIEPLDDDTLTFCLLNVRSLQKHAIDLKMDESLIKSHLLFLTETQLTSGSDTQSIRETLSPFLVSTNSLNHHRFSNIALAHQPMIEILNKYDIPGGSIYTLLRPTISNMPLNFILMYRQNQLRKTDFLNKIIQLLRQVDLAHVIMGDFNFDIYKDDSKFLRDFLSDYKMIVGSSTHISGSLIDHIYIHNAIYKEININVIMHSVYYSDHEAIKVKISSKVP